MGSAYGTTIENADLNYIQSNYGSGNATLNFNVNNQTVKYSNKHWQHQLKEKYMLLFDLQLEL